MRCKVQCNVGNLKSMDIESRVNITQIVGPDCKLGFATCALLLGGNIGNREDYINVAIERISENVGTVILRSKFYESEAWGFESQDKFMNVAIVIKTRLQPLAVLNIIKDIEQSLGRVKLKKEGYESRVIDIDIIFYDDLIFESPELTIPHRLMHKREFVLAPMREIIPDYVHPVLQTRIKEIVISD